MTACARCGGAPACLPHLTPAERPDREFVTINLAHAGERPRLVERWSVAPPPAECMALADARARDRGEDPNQVSLFGALS